jgi:ribokinase
MVLMQLETPLETIEFVAEIASNQNIPFLLNPAPACALPESLYQHISIITPNEKEAEMLTGVRITGTHGVKEAALILREKGVGIVIITLGAKGAFIHSSEVEEWVAAPSVDAVDTTAAGDIFNGALAVALSEQFSLTDAVSFACYAAALSVTKLGAQASAPFRAALDQFRQGSAY